MATGSGKTFIAVSAIYRLIRHARARRALFLVDRSNLAGRRCQSSSDSANLPEPDLLAAEIVQDLEAALEQFRAIAEDIQEERV